MKKSIFTLVMFCCALMGKAQVTDEQSAILQVGDEAQIFYGVDALVNAVAAAPDRGGVVTLSSGTFNGATITKCVDIYGAGWVEQKIARDNDNPSDNSILPTIISSKITISIPEELTAPHNIHIEGLRTPYGTGGYLCDKPIDGLEIMKCYIADNGTRVQFTVENKNVVITQSYINEVYGLGDALIQNCYIINGCNISCLNVNESHVVINHCIVGGHGGYGSYCKALFTNSMIWGNYGIGPSSTARNCMFNIGSISNVGSEGNIFGVDYNQIFEDATNFNYTDARTFKIKDELVNTYMGNDGTEIGINGGNYPWNKLPHTPLVKDLQLSIDGKQLKVEYSAETR